MTDVAWTPDFEGQREPFAPGNSLAVTHGAYSIKRVDPLANQFRDEILAVPHMSFLGERQNATIFWAWCRQAARVQLLEDWVDGMDMAYAADGTKGNTPPLEILRKATATLLTLTSRLGLDPLSFAKLHKDITHQQVDAATLLTRARTQAEGSADGT